MTLVLGACGRGPARAEGGGLDRGRQGSNSASPETEAIAQRMLVAEEGMRCAASAAAPARAACTPA